MFCCTGCASVYDLIASHGLEGFYACDIPAGVSQRNSVTRDGGYAVFDDEVLAARLIEWRREGRARVQFSIPAMHCASCVWLLEQLWRVVPGVERSEVDLLRRQLAVEFNEHQTSLRRIAERLSALGYPPVIDAEHAVGDVPTARRTLYLRIGLAGFAFGNVMLFSIPRYINGGPLEPTFQRLFSTLNLVFAVPVLLYSAAPYFQSAWQAVRARVMTLDVPVALGLTVLFTRSVADITSGRGEGFLDSFSGLVFFLLIGRLFQQKAFEQIAFDRTVRSFLPLSVRVARGDTTVLTPIDRVVVDDELLIRPQEVVPADSVLIDAAGAIDYAFATGESAAVAVGSGQAVAAGGRVIGRTIRLRVVRPVSQSQLVSLWSDPAFTRPKPYWLADVSNRFGWWFTLAALALAVGGAAWWWPDAGRAASVATAVLIIACPCALTLAAPITLGTAMGVLGRAGCYLKHPAVILDLSRVDVVAFDKTGTLTARDAIDEGGSMTPRDRELVSRLAAESVHPVSRALAGRGPVVGLIHDVEEVAGLGLSGEVDGHRVALGSAPFISAETGRPLDADDGRAWAAVDGALAGCIELDERRRPGIEAAVHALNTRLETLLLSGDRSVDARSWAPLFGNRLRFGMAPQDKLAEVQQLQAAGHRVLMVGDGLNDAGALRAASVGVAVSDDTACLVPACDAVIRGDRVVDLPAILAYARRARGVILLCFALSIAYNVVGLSLALTGRLTPLVTAILMPVSSLTVVGLSVGLMRRAYRPRAAA
ncbi:MAG: heavy metal translocating P-type ATPase metal-binding domain-containing protein [Acidobacteriota bacterium]